MVPKRRARGFFLIQAYSRLAAVSLAYWGWVALHLALGRVVFVEPFASSYILCWELLLIGLMIAASQRPRSQSPMLADSLEGIRNTVVDLTCALGLVLLYLAVSRDKALSRWFIIGLGPLLALVLAGCNLYWARRLPKLLFGDTAVDQVILVGHARIPEPLLAWLDEARSFGIRIVGRVGSPPENNQPTPIPWLGPTEDLSQRIQEHHVTGIVVQSMPDSLPEIRNVTNLCERLGVRLLVHGNFNELFGFPVTIVQHEGLRFLTLRDEPLQDPFNSTLKRGVDIAISLPVVLLLLPFAHVGVWIAHRMQSPGPLLYRQQRAGLRNQPFELLKYRTMHPNNSAARQATASDERIFAIGRWLRRLSLDELPQFINVLKGEMSVVGPRPHLPEHNEAFSRELQNYHVRAWIRPGITGLAQVHGFRGPTPTPEFVTRRVKSDIAYLENWSLSLDIAIIFRTVAHMLLPPDEAC